MSLLLLSPKDPIAEISRYRGESLTASVAENYLLASRWKLAADAAKNIFLQNTSNHLLKIQEPVFLENKIQFIQKHQEILYHSSLCREQKENIFTWSFASDETKEPSSLYRYWMARSQATKSDYLEREIFQIKEALQKRQSFPSQTVELAESAINFFSKSIHIETSSQEELFFKKELLSYRWRIAAYYAVHLASLHLQASLETLEDKTLSVYWQKIISLAQETLSLRIQVVEKTEKGEEEEAIQYTLAAYAFENATDAQLKFMRCSVDEKKTPSKKATLPLSVLWEEASSTNQKVGQIRTLLLEIKKTPASFNCWQIL